MTITNSSETNTTPQGSQVLAVPTFHEVPLKSMMEQQFSKDAGGIMDSASSTKQDDPFLYFTLAASRIDRLRHPSVDEDEGNDTDMEAEEERNTRFSTEVHITHEAILGPLLAATENTQGDVQANQNIRPDFLELLLGRDASPELNQGRPQHEIM